MDKAECKEAASHPTFPVSPREIWYLESRNEWSLGLSTVSEHLKWLVL